MLLLLAMKDPSPAKQLIDSGKIRVMLLAMVVGEDEIKSLRPRAPETAPETVPVETIAAGQETEPSPELVIDTSKREAREDRRLDSHNLMENLTSTPGHEKPLEKQVRMLAESPEVLQFLNALPYSSAPSGAKHDADGEQKALKGRGRGKGNEGKPSKGNEQAEPPKKFSVPKGCVSQIEGKPLCFAFNMGRCRFKTNNKVRCGRGFHLCWRQGCGEKHADHDCTRASHQ